MIPYLVTMRLHRRDGRRLRLWIPVPPVLLVLWPFLVLALPVAMIACLAAGVPPVGALRGIGRVLWALPGTRIEIEQGPTALLISVR
ncbi:hypothetical protein D5S18_20760 [Nocardia panacis]|uniref:Uncharacterized protein n=1 Tax=Nocardia panacis TaxID=2340916 RepID=A0A3A4K7W7_9NOCA|nr:hypothetical protein [Nocardia panacis]RJO73622.1 hypothetical protein D5S18_20760 [Nocardia panacis]